MSETVEHDRSGQGWSGLQSQFRDSMSKNLSRDEILKYTPQALLNRAAKRDSSVGDTALQLKDMINVAKGLGLLDDLDDTGRTYLTINTWETLNGANQDMRENQRAMFDGSARIKGHPELVGMSDTLVDGFFAYVRVTSIESIAAASGATTLLEWADTGEGKKWLTKHGYTKQTLANLKLKSVVCFGEVVADNDTFKMVGAKVVNDEPTLPNIPRPAPPPPSNQTDGYEALRRAQRAQEIENMLVQLNGIFDSVYKQEAAGVIPNASIESHLVDHTDQNAVRRMEFDAMHLQICLRINAAVALKRKGPDCISELQDVGLTGKDLSTLMSDRTFRIVMATLMQELFTMGPLVNIKDVGVPPNTPIGLVLTDQGKKTLMQVDSKNGNTPFDTYRDQLVSRVVFLLSGNPSLIPLGMASLLKDDVSPARKTQILTYIAKGYVGGAWNLLSLGLAVESGDNSRGVANYDPRGTALSLSLRTMINPYLQARSKYIAPDQGTEEDFVPVLGPFFAASVREKHFRERFSRYEPGYRMFPAKMCGSAFDHAIVAQNGVEFTLAQYLVGQDFAGHVIPKNAFATPSGMLYDYAQFDPGVFLKLKSNEIIGDYYANVMGPVQKIYNILATKEPAKPGAVIDFVTQVNKLRKQAKTRADSILSQIYANNVMLEDVLIGVIGAIAGGFHMGQAKDVNYAENGNRVILAQIQNYDHAVTDLLKDERIYRLLGANSKSRIREIRDRLLYRLYTTDVHDSRRAIPFVGDRLARDHNRDQRYRALKRSGRNRTY